MDGAGKSNKDLLVIGILEGIGTAILFVAINFSKGNPLIVVTGIFTGALLSGRLTGAHFNTAVTVGVFIAEDAKKQRANLKLAGVLLVSQIIGGYIGQLYSFMELGAEGIAAVSPANLADSPPWKVFLIETFFTFIMMTCIFHNIFPRLSIQSDMVLAVASVCVSIYFCIRCCAHCTGACFNPTVALVNITFVALVRINTGLPDFLNYLPAYFFGPLIGGILAGIFCKYFAMPHVPHYYDTMLTTFREDIIRYTSQGISGGGTVTDKATEERRATEVYRDEVLKTLGLGEDEKPNRYSKTGEEERLQN